MYVLSERVMQYEDKNIRDKALSLIPLDQLNIRIQKRMRVFQEEALKRKEPLNEASVHELVYLFEVMTWFKNEFFKWVDAPECVHCNGNTTFTGLSTNPANLVTTNRVEVTFICIFNGNRIF